jgi:hypothetical protein
VLSAGASAKASRLTVAAAETADALAASGDWCLRAARGGRRRGVRDASWTCTWYVCGVDRRATASATWHLRPSGVRTRTIAIRMPIAMRGSARRRAV